jgi:ClpP class serine protease
MSRLAFLSQRVFNTPLAVHPRKAEVIVAALAERLGVASMARLEADGLAIIPMAYDDWGDDDLAHPSTVRTSPDRGYDLLGPIAVIPVTGTLVQKNNSVRPYSGMTGYDGIRAAVALALDDPNVEKIALNIDSPGGEVAGCFDLVDGIFAARGDKPIWAVLDEMACSAAYAIASAADRVIVPRTGFAGSIGVIWMHVDFSQALGKAGIKVTFVTSDAADRKTDGHPEIPLSAEAFASIKGQIDDMGQLFYDTVARNRGLTSAAVRGLQADTFLGPKGLDVGLADAVMAPDAAFRALLGV